MAPKRRGERKERGAGEVHTDRVPSQQPGASRQKCALHNEVGACHFSSCRPLVHSSSWTPHHRIFWVRSAIPRTLTAVRNELTEVGNDQAGSARHSIVSSPDGSDLSLALLHCPGELETGYSLSEWPDGSTIHLKPPRCQTGHSPGAESANVHVPLMKSVFFR